jgi:DNA-binding beta-propeller fold protein YncE
VEYTSEGQQVREIRFDRSIKWAWHTVQLSSDQFIVSHGSLYSSLHRVCVINAEGQIIKSFGREEGGDEDQLYEPRSLAIDEKSKQVFVADTDNGRVLMLDSELMTCLGEVHVSRDLTFPTCLYFDSSTDRLFVAEHIYSSDFSPRLFVVTHPRVKKLINK